VRTPNLEARRRLKIALAKGPVATGKLVRELNISAPTLHRMLTELGAGGELVSAGKTRQRKHSLRRRLRGTLSSVAVFAVNASGQAAPASSVELVSPQGCHCDLDPAVWPESPEHAGWWGGLPYPLYDMRPQGYLGRLEALAIAPQLLSDNPREWSDDDILAYLVQYGSDRIGNLIVGEQAMQAWSRWRAAGLADVCTDHDTPERYPQLAQAAVNLGRAGSSVPGEFPKFIAARSLAGALTPHAIVKFSGQDNSAAVRRWSDLLVCEHLALEALGSVAGHEVARTRVLFHSGRTFLESERFDRHGDFGRSPVATLASLQSALIGGAPAQWPTIMRSRAAQGLFRAEAIARAEEMHWFGRFIANTDMHAGNLSLRPRGNHFELAPAYDMLPMHYSPLRGGEIPPRQFATEALPLPLPGREGDWHRVAHAAVTFWLKASQDARINEDFRSICAANGDALDRWVGGFTHAAVEYQPEAG